MKSIIINLLIPGVIFLSLSACNGVLEGIYDEPVEEFGFIEINEANNSGTIYIDATSYTRWTYINFHTLTIDSTKIEEAMQEPAEWDIAIHRYDAKTNEGSVIETDFSGFKSLKSSGKVPEGDYVKDEWTTSQIIIDMSGMMQGNIKYVESYYNSELSKWLKVDTQNMPPSYYPSNRVYMVKLKDGTFAALRLKKYMNASGDKGYMMIEYLYPFEI